MPSEGQFEEIAIGVCKSYSLVKPSFIARGSFKETYLTKINNHIPIALKIFDPKKCNLFRAEREITAMQQCESPFIAKLYNWGTYTHSDKSSFLFVMEEFLSGGTLSDRLGSTCPTATQVCDYGIALINAVCHLRDKSLVHRDIKPENIMFQLNQDVPILVDFGLVRNLGEVSLTPTYLNQGPCSPFFASPEQLNNDKHLIDWRADQFSIGVVLCICLTGNHPYLQQGQTAIDTVERVINHASCSSAFSAKAQESGFGFLAKMVSPWPIDRYGQPELISKEIENLKRRLQDERIPSNGA